MARYVSDWIKGFLDYTENSEPPRTFRLWTAISVVAAALQRKTCLKWGSLDFYPNLYIILVAPSGKARKGTAMTPGLKMLRKLNIKFAGNATTREALIKDLKLAGNAEIDPVTGTVDIHASLTIFSKELTVFLGYHNRELMSNLTDWYDCDDDWDYRTKTQGIDTVKGVWVNLIGATTPDLIQTSMPQDAIGGGLTSRMIFIYEEEKEKIVVVPTLTQKEIELYDHLITDLEKIHMLRGDFDTTKDFVREYSDWRIKQEQRPPFKESRFAGYFERRAAHILKLCVIVNAARTDSMVIDIQDFEKAVNILSGAEVKMPKTFAGVGKAREADMMSKVITEIGKHKQGMEMSELQHMFMYDADKWMMDNVIQTLQASGLIVPLHIGTKTILKMKIFKED